jgi:lambda family phage minor tail protein L
MGQGQDKIAISLLELEPTAIVELFLLYFNPKDDPDSFFAFHGGSLFQKPITWQGIEYLPLPVETEGFETNANGRIARPRIKVSNKDYIITDLLKSFNDLQFSKIIRKRTFLKFLDNVNFTNGNPWGQQDYTAELSSDTFVVSQKLAENKLFVEFELTSPLDIDGADINNRKILSSYCSFTYRGDGCYYKGIPLTNDKNETISPNARSMGAFQNGDPKSSFEWKNNFLYRAGDIIVIENKSKPIDYSLGSVVELNEPTFLFDNLNFLKNYYVAKSDHTSSLSNSPTSANKDVYWSKDECVKTINACKKRFNSESFTKSYTDSIKITDNYLDFTTKFAETTGVCLELTPTAQLDTFFDTGFYDKTFTIAMWISMNKKPLKIDAPYSLFTNANHTTQNNTEGAFALNYYLWNTKNPTPSLAQNIKIRKSDGTWKKNGTDENFWPHGGQVAVDGSYQLLLFECVNPKSAGGYVQLSINNNFPPEKITLGVGEQFSFAMPEYNSYRTGHFKINVNNIWGSWHGDGKRVTPANIHGLAIWSRGLSNAEKLWLGRADTEPNAIKEIQEAKTPRLISEVTSLYKALTGNNLQLWMNNEKTYWDNTNKRQFWYGELKNGQTSDDVYLRVTGLNNDIHNSIDNTFKYEYSYTKTPNEWLPFGGFPATYKFSYGEQ